MTALSKLNAYGTDFQLKTIALLLTDKKFLINTVDGIQPDYFENEGHRWIVESVIDYYRQYNTNPTKDYMEVKSKKLVDSVLTVAIKSQLTKCYRVSHEISDKEWVELEFKNFCMNQSIKLVINEAVEHIKVGNYDTIRERINEVFKLQFEKNLGIDLKKDLETIFREEDRKLIPFKWKALNDITDGGYGAGDLVLWFGNPGGGKTSAIISNAAHALLEGKNVLHYTLELSESYTAKKYFASLMDCEVKKLKIKEVNSYLKSLPGTLKIKEFPPKRASFDTIENHIQQLWIHEEFKPDMIIIDYLDYVKSNKIRAEKKDEIDDVYLQAKALAKELGISIHSPSQANRTAAESKIIEGHNAAGSYDKIMIADICISLARITTDKASGVGRIHIMKNRYGPDGITYLCEIDLSRNFIDIADEPMTTEQLKYADQPTKKQLRNTADKIRDLFNDSSDTDSER